MKTYYIILCKYFNIELSFSFSGSMDTSIMKLIIHRYYNILHNITFSYLMIDYYCNFKNLKFDIIILLYND